jgi:hypothetical protein
MRLVDKLLNYVHSGFNKEPDGFIALRVRHSSDAFSWVVSDRVLTLYDNGNLLHTIDLAQHTLRTLVNYLATLDQITVVYADQEHIGLSATTLIDGEGYQSRSNGDILRSYQSLLWVYLDAMSTELAEAKRRIIDMLDQMAINTADADWLDEWGDYFGIYRETGELDDQYANRIILEVIRPRGNNRAIEAALLQKYGQSVDVIDVTKYGNPLPNYGGSALHDSVYLHNSENKPLYGLFQIIIGYDLLLSGAPPAFIQSVRDFVEKFRDAGTHLDSVNLLGSEINDTFVNPPVDSGINLSISRTNHFNGAKNYDSSFYHSSSVTNESF